MSYDASVFVKQFPIVRRFIYHYASYKTLFDVHKDYKLNEKPFWIITIDAHLLQASTLWCMVFGSENNNDIHWKKLSTENHEKFQNDFRAGLTKDLEIKTDEWEKYWQEMVDFRNGYAVHLDLDYEGHNVPYFDKALKTAFYYDSWVRKVISPDVSGEPAFTHRYEEFCRETSKVITDLFKRDLT